MAEFNMCEVLSEATSLKPMQRETAFTFSRRLIKELSADDFSTDKWDSLPDEAQEWVNEQIRATNENKQIDEVPGFTEFTARPSRFRTAVDAVEAEPVVNGEAVIEEVEEEEEEVEEVKKPTRRVRATTPKEPKEAKEPSEPRNYRTRKNPDGKPSAIMRLKELLIENGSLTPNQLMQVLEDEGYKISQTTVISCKADFRATVSVLQRHGLMNVELVK
jgi:hypothetical protein